MLSANIYADLEIRILKREDAGYPVEITLDGGQEFPRGFLAADILPWISTGDPRADGERLFAALFDDAAARTAWDQARGQHPQRRVRLRLDPQVLHTLPWELLHDDKNFIAAHTDTPFSRYLPLHEPHGGPIIERPIRVLAAIANPADLAEKSLTPIDVGAERCQLKEILCAFQPNQVQLNFLEAPVTLERLESTLRAQRPHILHLIAHGVFSNQRDQAALYLQDDVGNTRCVTDAKFRDIVDRLGEDRPSMVFLAVCESAARSLVNPFAGLAPRLMEAGVPAVVAMQDEVSFTTIHKLTPEFYRGLFLRGEVDRALNAARSLLLTEESPDAGVPVLLMRLKEGRLFQVAADVRQAVQQRYPFLKDYVYDVTSTIEIVTQWFVGREFVFDWLEAQLRTLPCGYLHLVADAGLGKTAIAAEVARRYGALVYFFDASGGVTRIDRCLNHLAASLIARYELPHGYLPERAGLDSNFLQTVLQEAADQRGDAPVLLVIDALDEADPVSAGRNWLHLPDHLPPGVYVLLTHRPGDYPIAADAQTPQMEPLVIAWDDPRQQGDIAAHLRRQTERPEIRRALTEATPPIAIEQFVTALQTAAEGNFMYLDYILADIAAREPSFDPLDMQKLPISLEEYYKHFWRRMCPQKEAPEVEWDMWEARHLPILEALGVAGEPVTVCWLADQTGLPERTVSRILANWKRFLRCEQQPNESRVWRIVHRSFADFLVKQEEVNLRATHQRMAKYYLDAWGGWEAGLPNLSVASEQHGGYGLRHLSEHLNGAQWWEPLHALFASDAWLQLRVASDDYTYDGYLTDLECAWRRAEAQVKAGDADALAECIRYALICTSVNSFNYVPELVARAVELGIWTVMRAFSVANQMPNAKWRSKMYRLLLELPNTELTPVQRREAQVLGLKAMREISVEEAQSQALVMLAPQLTDDDLVTEALTIAQAIESDEQWALALAALSRKKPETERKLILAEVLRTARATEDQKDRADILVALAPQLTEDDLMEEALAVIRDSWWWGGYETVALAALAPHLPDKLLEEVLMEISEESESHQAGVLVALAPRLINNDLVTKALTMAREMEGCNRAKALAALAQQVPDEKRGMILAEALGLVQNIEYGWEQAEVLVALAPRLIDDKLLMEALATVRKIEYGEYQAKALVALAPHLSKDDLVTEALTVARAVEFGRYRAPALATLADQLPAGKRGPVLREALIATQEGTKRYVQAKSLSTVAPHLSGAPLAEALTIAQEIDNIGARSEALAALAPQLTDDLLRQALMSVKAIGDEKDQVKALAALTPQIPKAKREPMLAKALKIAQEVVNEPEWKIPALTAVALQMPEVQRGQIVEMALNTIGKVWSQAAQALVNLVPYLTPHQLRKMLMFQRGRGPVNKAKILTALSQSQYLPEAKREAMLTEALALVQKKYPLLDEGNERISVFTTLASCLTGKLLTEALAIARAIEDKKDRVKVMAALTRQILQPERELVLEEVLAAAQSIEWEIDRVEALTAVLASRIPEIELQHERIVTEALTAARAIEWEHNRAPALAMLTQQMLETERIPVLKEVLKVTQVIGQENYRAQLLSAWYPQWTDESLAKYLSIIRMQTLSTLLLCSEGGMKQTVREEYQLAAMALLRAMRNEYREYVLQFLSGEIGFDICAVGLTQAAAMRIVMTILDICQRWEWL